MKTSNCLLALCGLAWSVACPAQDWRWYARPGDDLQFGISAVLDGQPAQTEQVPSVFGEFSSAYALPSVYFGGWGQTFTVPSLRTLQSVELRLGQVSSQPGDGEFEVGLYRFDTMSGTPIEKLGSVAADASNYRQAWPFPVSSFDFSSLNLSLRPAETYGLAVTPKPGFTGALSFSASFFQDAYPGGTAYALEVPEPATVSICLLGIAVAVSRLKKAER